MQYTVLARKYRPQTFEQIYAQDHVTKILISSVEKDRIAGAYLFTGPRGVGKTSLARIFAKSLNCLEGPTVHPCGKCSNCTEIEKAISYDVAEIDGASNTGVDDIRELQRELMFTTTSSRYKIYIIDEVHMLSTSAFNALLKTLEEPPERVIFMFATTEPHKILPTILSRCQRFDLKRIPFGAILDNLKAICKQEKIQAQAEALAVIAHKADGGMRDALSLLDQMISYSSEKISHQDVLFMFGIISWQVYLNILEKIIGKDTAGVLEEFARVVDDGNGVVEFMVGFLEFLSSLLTLFYSGKSQEMPKDVAEKALQLAKSLGERTLILIIDILAETVGKIKQAGNQAFVAELALIRLSKVEQLKSVDKIITYLKSNAGKSVVPVVNTAKVATISKPSVASSRPVVESSRPVVESSRPAVESSSSIAEVTTSTAVKPTPKSEPSKEETPKVKPQPNISPKKVEAKTKSQEQASPPEKKELTQSQFDAALPEINDLLKDNDFGMYLTNFFGEYPKKILPGNVLQIELPNKLEQASFGKDAGSLVKMLSSFFGVSLQLSVKLSSKGKIRRTASVSDASTNVTKPTQVEAKKENEALAGIKDAKVAKFIEKIDGEIIK